MGLAKKMTVPTQIHRIPVFQTIGVLCLAAIQIMQLLLGRQPKPPANYRLYCHFFRVFKMNRRAASASIKASAGTPKSTTAYLVLLQLIHQVEMQHLILLTLPIKSVCVRVHARVCSCLCDSCQWCNRVDGVGEWVLFFSSQSVSSSLLYSHCQSHNGGIRVKNTG